MTRVGGAHGVVGPVVRMAFDCTLHSNATIEDGIDEGRNIKDISNGGKNRVFTERVTSESTTLLNETFGAHILKGSFLYNECNLSKLGGKPVWMTESILGRAGIDKVHGTDFLQGLEMVESDANLKVILPN